MKVSELAGAIAALTTTVDGIKTEVDALKASLADVDLPPAAETALTNLTGHIQAVQDDLNPPPAPAPSST